jgi:FAD/FMN-containing dehydrogenase
VADVIASGIIPCALEMIDQNILRSIEAAFHLGFPLDCSAVLLIELDGFEAGLDEAADAVRAICARNRAREVRSAVTPDDRAKLWIARKKGIGVMGRFAPSHVTQDGVIPRSKLPEVLREVAEIARRHGVMVCNIFHAGDGNLHPAMVYDERDPDQVRRVMAAGHEILRLCVSIGGTITGEHGVGVEKLAFMNLVFSQDDLATMRKLRRVFDPSGLCNPGKLIPEQVAP